MSGDDIDTPAAFDSPDNVAAAISALTSPVLVVFDCDGVLSPLVDHADDSVLLPGIRDRLAELSALRPVASQNELRVAVLSGRSLAGLAQFDFPDGVIVAGSYGGERSDRTTPPLTHAETERLSALDAAAEAARRTAGDGAWIERKPTSVVLHVRTAEPESGATALEQLVESQRFIDGSSAHSGSNVLELMARPTDKGTALTALRDDEAAASVVYLGDDVPDEDAFAVLGPDDLSIKVGTGDTVATWRLADPEAVRDLLTALAGKLCAD